MTENIRPLYDFILDGETTKIIVSQGFDVAGRAGRVFQDKD